MNSADWAQELTEDLDKYDGIDDQIDYALEYGATLGGITVDQPRCDRTARRLVSIEFPAGRGAKPYPVMAVQWDGGRWRAS